MPFSKDQEFEADKLGVSLLTKAGYGKKGAIDFFARLHELEKKYQTEKRNAFNDFISSHHNADQRKKRSKELK
ncbi:MAG: M48 family metalloprotease [Ignavibacteriaceae bacterium]|nr:M48 family metalloprotease [Ignavibacteriaceae bacterium]